ncbi:MAG: TonB-dependent receptor [Chitinophagaceae bacterium]|nr:TonB-dependent receptor [Chitinophagaceae bacterium]
MKYLLCVFLTFIGFNLKAQVEKEPLPAQNNTQIVLTGKNTVLGKVLELGSDKPLEAASVQLFSLIKDPFTKKQKDSLIAVMLTKPNGDFSFSNIPTEDSLKLVVSSVGHSASSFKFHFKNSDEPQRYDVGNIIMVREAQKLQGIVITAATPPMRMGIDKKIFDVSQSLTAQGGTAVDALKTIPSVSVDLNGNVEFRNSTPTIFVDGRPTILTLDQIPSENIDRIELISNPSAKYDASSSGGIINIILKKNKRQGFNGIVSVAGGTPSVFNSNVSLNLRQNKFNFFVTGGYHTSGGVTKGSSERTNKENGIATDYFKQESANHRHRQFKSLRGGLDFFVDNRNILTISQGIVQGDFNNEEEQDQRYMDVNKNLTRLGLRTSDEVFGFRRNNSQLNYTHKFPHDGEELDASVNVNYGKVHDNTNIANSFFLPDNTPDGLAQLVRNQGSNNNNQWTTQIDYTNPINDNKKIEAGLRSYINNYESLFNTFSVNGSVETKLPLSNHYKYTEQVQAAYFTYTDKIGKFGYQLGLRGEYSNFDGTLIDSAQKFGYKYPSGLKTLWNGLFPSIFLSEKISDNDELQINYSRRIRRPNFWQLNPFIDINDPLNIQQGNPALKPEFKNSFEFNYSKTYGAGNNLLATIYYRTSQNDITQYSDTLTTDQFKQLNNSAVDPNAILNTFINANSKSNLGLELTLQQKVFTGFSITPSLSMQYQKVNAQVNNLDLSNTGFNWRSKLQVNYKITTPDPSLWNNFSFQMNGVYQSPNVIPQGKRLHRYRIDIALRKDFLKNNSGSLVLGINDLFNSDHRGIIYDTPSFYQESYSRWSVRSFKLTFSYKFGNSDFKIFNKKNNNHDEDSDG